MKNILLAFLLITALAFTVCAQTNSVKQVNSLNENSVVTDSSGIKYPYFVWKKMISTGSYQVRTIQTRDTTIFRLVELTDAQKADIYKRMQKPVESKFFTDGEKISLFSATDINGNKVKLKDYAGKVIVLNFWFIGCPPCRMEIPELNKIALKYTNDPDVVFVAVALDEKYDIKQFIKTNPFGYHIIDGGGSYASMYKINLYPTNVVLDKAGKVRFHGSGYALNTPYWISKTIEEAKHEVVALQSK